MKSFKGGLFGCLGVGAAILLVIIVIVAIGTAGSKGGNSSGSPRPVGTATLIDKSGNGQWTSPTFHAPDEWTITYSYDCTTFGQSGNFAIYVEGDTSDVSANTIGMKGNDTATVHGGGNVHLSVLSECSWSLTAKG